MEWNAVWSNLKIEIVYGIFTPTISFKIGLTLWCARTHMGLMNSVNKDQISPFGLYDFYFVVLFFRGRSIHCTALALFYLFYSILWCAPKKIFSFHLFPIFVCFKKSVVRLYLPIGKCAWTFAPHPINFVYFRYVFCCFIFCARIATAEYFKESFTHFLV